MRILIIAPKQYPVPNIKGTSVEKCLYNIASRLARHHFVTIVSRKTNKLPYRSKRGNLTILRVQSISEKAYIHEIIKAVKGKHFDIIQIDNRPNYLKIVRNAYPNARLSLFLHSLTFVTPPKASPSVVRNQISKSNLIITNSFSLKTQMIKRYPRQADKIRVVHLGVDLTKFRPPTISERWKIRARYKALGTFSIVYAGRFTPIKGIPRLINAAEIVRKQIPNTKLYLAGGGKKSYEAYLKRLAHRAKVPVQFMGYLSKKLVHHAYWLADCFVCPTQGHEAFGLVVVEALACKVPTIASHNGGIRETIQHNRNGLLVAKYRSSQAFASAIIRIAKNKYLADRLGAAGRLSCVKRFSWNKTSANLAKIYRKQLIR